MTEDQIKQMKLACFVHWMITRKHGGDSGLRDIRALEAVVSLPGGGSLTCLQGERLSNRKDLYAQLGWFVYYIVENEPFNSKNHSVAFFMTTWCLRHYQLDFDPEQLRDYIVNLDTMKQGNSDISLWFGGNCR